MFNISFLDLIPYGWGHDNDGMNNHEPGVPLLDQAILKDEQLNPWAAESLFSIKYIDLFPGFILH